MPFKNTCNCTECTFTLLEFSNFKLNFKQGRNSDYTVSLIQRYRQRKLREAIFYLDVKI